MSEGKNLTVELIMDGGWNIQEGSNFDPGLDRPMSDISENYFRTGLDFNASDLEALAESGKTHMESDAGHFSRFYDIVETEVLSVDSNNHISIDLAFNNRSDVTFTTSADEVQYDEVLKAIKQARDLGLSGRVTQAYLSSDPGVVRQLRENLSEDPELSMDYAFGTGFVCDGHFLKTSQDDYTYAVVAGGEFYRIKGDKAVLIESSRDHDTDDELEI